MLKVLVVGQTPPPYGGQAMMIKRLMDGRFEKIDLRHVRMEFSREMDEHGVFQVRKVAHLAELVAKIHLAQRKFGADVLYYPPAGPARIPMFRDMALLLSVRRLFKRTVFHFHAGGISKMLDKISPLEAVFFKRAYFDADVAIKLSHYNPPDGERLMARQVVVVPYGIEDVYPGYGGGKEYGNVRPRILFVGVLQESKGVLVLLDACRLLRRKGIDFSVEMIGCFQSIQFEREVRRIVCDWDLEDRIEFPGVLSGDEKWKSFLRADIFCFPSHFESETFGLVVLEAMQFELPVVATMWRGIQSLVRDGESGYLVPTKNGEAVAEKLEILINDSDRRKSMGETGRRIFLEEYTIERWYERMEDAILKAAQE